jgi:hypothetical protein
MPQKAPKEQMPALIAELSNRSQNVKHMKALQKFISQVAVSGADVLELGMAINWLNNVVVGEDARCAEIKGLLPDQDTVIDMTKPEEKPADAPAPHTGTPAEAVSQGAVEMSKGSEVLQPA